MCEFVLIIRTVRMSTFSVHIRNMFQENTYNATRWTNLQKCTFCAHGFYICGVGQLLINFLIVRICFSQAKEGQYLHCLIWLPPGHSTYVCKKYVHR